MTTTASVGQKIAQRIDEELVDMCHEVNPETFQAECARLIDAELPASVIPDRNKWHMLCADLGFKSPSETSVAQVDAELARERDAVDALIQAALQYIDDTAGEQEDEEEIAKSLGRYAPLSLRNLRECAARLRKLR